jgi:hypothetical protein
MDSGAPLVKPVMLLFSESNIIWEYIPVVPHYLVNNYARLPWPIRHLVKTIWPWTRNNSYILCGEGSTGCTSNFFAPLLLMSQFINLHHSSRYRGRRYIRRKFKIEGKKQNTQTMLSKYVFIAKLLSLL